MKDPDKAKPDRPSLAGLDLQRLMVEGLNPDSGAEIDETPPEIDGYEILRPIGRGGMGQVFLARQESLDRLVAVKRIGGAGAAATTFLDRLEREAKTMARVSHPNLVGVFDFVRLEDGNAALIMEWVAGGNLQEVELAKKKPLGVERTLALIDPILSGLEAAHEAGIIHRDIKPDNILFAADGTIKVTDFGLSIPTGEDQRLTVTGTYVGTPGYMAPEQQEGGPPDVRTDLYAIGVMLYEMLTGKSPVGNFDSPRKCNPAIPRHFEDAILACLKTDPKDRPDSVASLRKLLLGEKTAHSRRSALVAATAGVAALGGTGWFFWGREKRANEIPSPEIEVPPGSNSRFTPLTGDWHQDSEGIESNSEIAFCSVYTERDVINSRVRFSFTRLSGEHSVALFFRLPNGFGSCELSAWEMDLGGVQTIDGTDLRGLPDAFRFPLENNRRYEVEMVVTSENIVTSVDGIERQTQPIAGREFGIAQPWQKGIDFSQTELALATYQSPTLWHSISVEAI